MPVLDIYAKIRGEGVNIVHNDIVFSVNKTLRHVSFSFAT